jgi:hypothetical protein
MQRDKKLIVTLSIMAEYCDAEGHYVDSERRYAECCYVDSRYAECRYTSVVMLIVMLSFYAECHYA